MAVIAVAGGSGQVGRTIVEVLCEDPNNTVLVLGRRARDTQTADGPATLAVDYGDVAGTARVLARHRVDTVICAIFVVDPASADAQGRLVEAAVQAGTVARFVASDWGPEQPESSPIHPLRQAVKTRLATTSLQWTTFHTGYFLDYYAPPRVRSHMAPAVFAVDVQSRAAGIPGTGDDVVAFIYSFDVARFVARLLREPVWDRKSYVYGDRLTMNQLLALAEAARGPFSVAYDPPEALARGAITELPGFQKNFAVLPETAVRQYLALFGLWVIAGLYDVPPNQSLNARFPDVKTTSAAAILDQWRDEDSV